MAHFDVSGLQPAADQLHRAGHRRRPARVRRHHRHRPRPRRPGQPLRPHRRAAASPSAARSTARPRAVGWSTSRAGCPTASPTCWPSPTSTPCCRSRGSPASRTASPTCSTPTAARRRRARATCCGRSSSSSPSSRWSPIVGPELEFYVLEESEDVALGLAALRRGHRQRLRLRSQGRPGERAAQLAAPAGRVRHRGHLGQPRVLLRPVRDQPVARRRRSTPPTGRTGSRHAVKELALHEGRLATFMPKPFNDEGGSGYHLHFSMWSPDRSTALFDDPDGAERAVGGRPARGRRHPHPRPGAGGGREPDDQLLQALRPRHARPVADRLGHGQPQRHGPDPAGAGPGLPDGAAAR